LWTVWDRARSRPPRATVRKRIESKLSICLIPTAVTAFFVATAFSESLLGTAVNPLLVCLVWAGLRVGSALFTPGFAPLRKRLRYAFETIPDLLVASIPVFYACVSCAAFSLGAVGSVQGALPWQWSLFTNPALLIAFPFYLAVCSKGPRPGPGRYRSKHLSARLMEILGGATMCAIGAAVFLGGWQMVDLPVVASDVAALIGAMAFAMKAWVMGYLIDAFREIRVGYEIPLRPAAVALVGSSVIAGIWAFADIPPVFEAAVGFSLFAATVVLVASGAFRSLRPARPTDLSPVHVNPFL
jgi:hypothetical protein